jgi:hypothetical protein
MIEAISDKYLGLPPIVGLYRLDGFKHLIDKVSAKLNGWKEKLLSFGDKEVLLKAITHAIPGYAMSAFELTKQILNEIISADWLIVV